MSDLVWFLEKSTLNPDLPYNRLLYNRFLLYQIESCVFEYRVYTGTELLFPCQQKLEINLVGHSLEG